MLMTEHSYHLVQNEEKIGPFTLNLTGLRDFDEAVDELFRELETRGEGERLTQLCPFFGKVWPSARGLARYLAERGGLTGATRVLEVGCGLALPGLIAARLGAQVTVCDFHPDVATFLARNMASNGLPDLSFLNADWHDPDTFLGTYDVVMGSDILYDRQHAEDLVRFVSRHLSPDGRCLLADPGRAYLQEFTSRMQASGFRADVGVDQVADGAGNKDVFVIEYASEVGRRS